MSNGEEIDLEVRKAVVRASYEPGTSCAEAGEPYGVSAATVRQWRRRARSQGWFDGEDDPESKHVAVGNGENMARDSGAAKMDARAPRASDPPGATPKQKVKAAKKRQREEEASLRPRPPEMPERPLDRLVSLVPEMERSGHARIFPEDQIEGVAPLGRRTLGGLKDTLSPGGHLDHLWEDRRHGVMGALGMSPFKPTVMVEVAGWEERDESDGQVEGGAAQAGATTMTRSISAKEARERVERVWQIVDHRIIALADWAPRFQGPEVSDAAFPWSRIETEAWVEPTHWFDRFITFLRLGRGRDLSAAMDVWGEGEDNGLRRMWYHAARHWAWHDRATSFDVLNYRRRVAQEDERRQENKRRRDEALDFLGELGIEAARLLLKRAQDDPELPLEERIADKDLANVLKLALEQGRIEYAGMQATRSPSTTAQPEPTPATVTGQPPLALPSGRKHLAAGTDDDATSDPTSAAAVAETLSLLLEHGLGRGATGED